MKTFLKLLPIILCVLGSSGTTNGDAGVELDYESPAHCVFEGRWPDISRVQVCVSGPKKSFDSYAMVEDLLSRPSIYVSTNFDEIRSLFVAFHDHNNSLVNDRVLGYTHHFLFFEEGGKKVMHFRVFSVDLSTKGRANVYPRSDTGFGYANGDIIPWIKAHYATNATYKDYLEKNPLKE